MDVKPSRVRKPYQTANDDEASIPLPVRLRGLLLAYEDCPGIVADVRALLRDMHARGIE